MAPGWRRPEIQDVLAGVVLALSAAAAPPPMQKVVTKSATFVLYAPKDWEVTEGEQPGFRTVSASAPGGSAEAALFFGTNPAGSDLPALVRRFTGGIAGRFPDFAITTSRVSPDRRRIVFDARFTHPRLGRREMRAWVSGGGDRTFLWESIEAGEGRLASERRLLLTILANVRVLKGAYAAGGRAPPAPLPLAPYRLREGSASFSVPQDFTVHELGRGHFVATDAPGLRSFAVADANFLTPRIGVRPKGALVSPLLEPHRALPFLMSATGLSSDMRADRVFPRPDLAREMARVYTSGSVTVEEFLHSSTAQGRRCRGYTLGISYGARLDTNWIFTHLSVGAPAEEFDGLLPTYVEMLASYRVSDAWAKQYVASGLARLRQLQQETAAIVARNAQEIHSMMQAAYDERQRSQDYIDYQRTSYIRGTSDWISSVEGGAVYHSDSWGTKNTTTGETWTGQPWNAVNFDGQSPKHDESLTRIDSRELFEKTFR